MMFAWGQVYQQKNCCSVKELCIHSRENPSQIKDKKQIRTWKKAIIISKDNIRFYFSSKTKITLVQRTIFVFRILLNNIAVN